MSFVSSGGGGGGGGETAGPVLLSGGGGGGVNVGDADIFWALLSSRCRKKKEFEQCIKKERDSTHSPLKPERMPDLTRPMKAKTHKHSHTFLPLDLHTHYTMSHDRVCRHCCCLSTTTIHGAIKVGAD